MAVMCGVVSALSAFYHDALRHQQREHREICAFRLLSKMPTLAAMLQVLHRSALHAAAQRLSYAGNFLHMMFGADRRVQGQPHRRARHGPHLHPACGPRAERLHLHRASGRFLRRQPVCLYRRGIASRARPTVPTKPASRCSRRLAPWTAFPSTSPRPRTRTIRSV
jgi:hypothetical protein